MIHDLSLNVATSGTGERVKMIVASFLCVLMSLKIFSRLRLFSSTLETLKPWHSGSNFSLGIALQNASPFFLLYQISDKPRVIMKTLVSKIFFLSIL